MRIILSTIQKLLDEIFRTKRYFNTGEEGW